MKPTRAAAGNTTLPSSIVAWRPFALSLGVFAAACSVTPTFSGDTSGAGAGGGGGQGGDGGTAAACSVPSDCPGAEDACASRTCVGGACGKAFKPAGFVIAVQPAGDCQRQICDGQGAIKTEPFPSDVPIDGDPCTDDLCSGAVPSNPLEPAGAPCGAASGAAVTCDAAGQCTGCAADTDCPPSSACTTYACDAGVCVFTNLPSGGGNLGGQVTGDCALKVCNGKGNVSSIADDTDKPVDDNPCTEDECAGGSARNPPVADGTPCGPGGETCLAGVCGG